MCTSSSVRSDRITHHKKVACAPSRVLTDINKLQGYQLMHITFTPVAVTPSGILHSMVQGINKETPFSTATHTAEPQVLPYKIRPHLPIG